MVTCIVVSLIDGIVIGHYRVEASNIDDQRIIFWRGGIHYLRLEASANVLLAGEPAPQNVSKFYFLPTYDPVYWHQPNDLKWYGAQFERNSNRIKTINTGLSIGYPIVLFAIPLCVAFVRWIRRNGQLQSGFEVKL